MLIVGIIALVVIWIALIVIGLMFKAVLWLAGVGLALLLLTAVATTLINWPRSKNPNT